MRAERRTDWKTIITIVSTVLGVAVWNERRLTSIEEQIKTFNKPIDMIRLNSDRLIQLEMRMNLCEKHTEGNNG